MASQIDDSVPTAGHAYTDQVRSQLTIAKNEISDLQRIPHALKLLEQKGAVFSGFGSAAADTAAIQSLIDEYEAMSASALRKPQIFLPNPAEIGTDKIYLSAGLVVDVSKIGLFDGSGNKLYGANLSNTSVLTLTGTFGEGASGGKFEQNISAVQNLIIVGDIRTGTVQGISLTGSDTAGAAYVSLRDIHIRDCSIGELNGFDAHLIKHYNVSYYSCGVAFRSIAGDRRGENITWFGGVIAGCLAGFEVTDLVQGSLFGTSFDHNEGPLFVLNNSSLFVFGGNYENRYEGSWVTIDGVANVFQVVGGFWLHTGPFPHENPETVTCTNGGRAIFRDVKLYGFDNDDSVFGSGNIHVSGSSMSAVSYMPAICSTTTSLVNATFENASFDGLIIHASGTLGWATRLSGTNIELTCNNLTTAHLGSGSLGVQKTGSGACSFYVYVPILPGMLMSRSHWDRNIGGTVTGTYNITEDWVAATKDETGEFVSSKLSNIGTSSNYTPVDAWTNRRLPPFGNRLAPAWATHYRLQFNFANLGVGTIYLDDLHVSGW